MKNANSFEHQPISTMSSRQIIGKTALTSNEDLRSKSLPEAKNISQYRKELLDQGHFPIETKAGSDKCYGFLLEQALDNSFNSHKKSVSRQLKLESHKNPDWSESDSVKAFQNASIDVASHILATIREVYQKHGINAVHEQFPNIKNSGTDWTQILTISHDSLSNYYDNLNNPGITPSLRSIINCCNLMDEHAGAITECPYKVTTEYTEEAPADHSQFSDGRYRIYLNPPSGKARTEFLASYAKKCIDQRIPFDMKGVERLNKEPGSTPSYFDSTVFYILPEHLEKSIKILEAIKQESPNLIARFGSPIATADNIDYYSIAQSRKQATWNHLFDRVSKWAFYKTMTSQMLLEGIANDDDNPAYLQDNASFKLSTTTPIISEEMHNYIQKKYDSLNLATLKSMFFINLKQLFSLVNFDDTKHTEYPFCFSKTFYSSSENTPSIK